MFAGQLCVALVFAELAASWPLAGCIYQWSRRLAGEIVGWFAGWAMLIGYIVSVAAIGIALQAVLPAVCTVAHCASSVLPGNTPAVLDR